MMLIMWMSVNLKFLRSRSSQSKSIDTILEIIIIVIKCIDAIIKVTNYLFI